MSIKLAKQKKQENNQTKLLKKKIRMEVCKQKLYAV